MKNIWKYRTIKAPTALPIDVVEKIGRIWAPQGYLYHDNCGRRNADNTVTYSITYKKRGIRTRTITTTY